MRTVDELRARLARPGVLTLATGVVVCAAAALRYARHVMQTFGGFTVDDAGITFAYADNLAHGAGLRLTAGQAPVEGFSNFLEVLLLEPFAAANADLAHAAKLLNLGAMAVALTALSLFIWRRLRGPERGFAIVPALLAGYWVGFSYWIAAGLEGGLLAALQIAGLLALVSAARSRASDAVLGAAAGLLAWCRPEAIVYGALLIGARQLVRPRRFLAPGIAAALVVLLFAVRWLAFRSFLPNTFWAKVDPGRDLTTDGWTYVTDFLAARWWYLAVPLPLFAGFARQARVAAATALAFVIMVVTFAVRAGGDWMFEWRFLQPALGPLAFAASLGVVAILERPEGDDDVGRRSWRAAIAVAALWPAAMLYLAPPGWDAHVTAIASRRNVSFERIWSASSAYRKVRKRIHLGRRPLHADIDVGGMAYRSGLDVIDLAGLADATLSRGWTRTPGVVVDYLFGQRLPDTVHVHGGWIDATPIAYLSPFPWLYRSFAAPLREELNLSEITAVRGDLVDPRAAPVARVSARLPGAVLTGFTALRRSSGDVALFAHARQGGDVAAPIVWVARDGQRSTAEFHAGLALDRGPPGSSLVAAASVPASSLPLVIEGTGGAVRVERWPLVDPSVAPADVEGWLRRPLARLGEVPASPCDPEPLLDESTEPARWVRGAAFLVGACAKQDVDAAHDVLDRCARLALASAHKAPSSDERWDAALAAGRLGRSSSLEVRRLLDRGRDAHTPYDEVIGMWAAQTAAADDLAPEAQAEALRLLVGARRYEDALTDALAYGLDRPGIAPAACTAARRMGLHATRLRAGLDCTGLRDVALNVARQSFEREGDASVMRSGDAFAFVATEWDPERGRLAGGHGTRVASSGTSGDAAVGELTWGPMPWPGGRFGALLAGDADPDRLHVVVEGRDKGRTDWRELGRLAVAHARQLLAPQLLDLRGRRADEVRVRVVDHSNAGHIVIDALTFTD